MLCGLSVFGGTDMEKILNLHLENTSIGTLTAEDGDMHITFTARVPIKLSGIVRAYASGSGGRVLIGVLAPCDGGFSVKKTLSKTYLSSVGITFENISNAYASFSSAAPSPESKTPDSIWVPVKEPCAHLAVNSVTDALAKSVGALCDDNSEPTRLAVILSHDRPFPRPDTLCMMTPKRIDGAMYAVCKISKSGEVRRMQAIPQ